MLKLLRRLGAVVAIVVVFISVNRLFGPTLDPDGAVTAYLDAVRRGDRPVTCEHLPAVPDDFSGVDDYRIVRTMASNDSNEGRVFFEATTDGQTHPYEARIVREGGSWKWCGLNPTGP